ncbi:MAG: type II toxin-antitoxin system CcdA family antitoxin [Alphaproteobacteria bacterium]|jgi:antitoxin CcdA|nr:type II toxin-antitoxin system CcdA family antitoxin [Alphaproteobacteria bacterium]|tara:strand:+ start:358 stop:585 length:228 start_codon:yes stop_codon:yes gene_type:complete
MPAPKKRTTVTIDPELQAFAKKVGLNLSGTLEAALRAAQREEARARWLRENGEAIEHYNRRIAGDGVFGSEFRRY